MRALAFGLAALLLGTGSWHLSRRHFLALVSAEYRQWITCIDEAIGRIGSPEARYRSVLARGGAPDVTKELANRHSEWELAAEPAPLLDRHDAIVFTARLEGNLNYQGAETPADRPLIDATETAGREVTRPRSPYSLRVCRRGPYWAAIASKRFRPDVIELR